MEPFLERWAVSNSSSRFWSAGPQRTLYVPAPVTRARTNEIVVLTLDAASSATARFVPSALLGPTEE